MDANDLTPFRISKPFEENIPEVLNALAGDPDGFYQITYRVGPLVVSAQIWRDPAWGNPKMESFSEFDLQLMREMNVALTEPSAGALP